MSNHPKFDDSTIVTLCARQPTLKEAQAIVGGNVQSLTLPNGDQLLVHEEGRLLGMAINVTATERWPHWGALVGPVIYLTGAARWT